MPYFAPLWTSLDHLCIHYVHIVYITALFPHCILSATIFPISTIFSPSFFGFSSAIFFSISIYCGFTSFYQPADKNRQPHNQSTNLFYNHHYLSSFLILLSIYSNLFIPLFIFSKVFGLRILSSNFLISTS